MSLLTRSFPVVTWLVLVACCFQEGATFELDDLVAALRDRENAFLAKPAIYMEFENHREYFEKPMKFTERYVSARQDGMFYLYRDSPFVTGDREIRHSYWYSWKDNIALFRFEQTLRISQSPDINLWDMNHYANAMSIDYFQGLDVVIPELESLGARTFSEAIAKWDGNLVGTLSKTESGWKVSDESEKVEGAACVVIRSPTQGVIWLDPKLGFACRKRIRYTQVARNDYSFHRFREYPGGLWVPQEIEVKRYFSPGEANGADDKLRLVERLVLKKLSFAKLPVAFFDIEIPDNALITDEIRGMEYTTYSKDAPDDLLLNRPLVQARTRLRQMDRLPTLYHWLGVTTATVAGLALVVIMVLARR